MPLTNAQRAYLEQRLMYERALALRYLNRRLRDHADDTVQDDAGDLATMPFHLADCWSDADLMALEASTMTRASRVLAEIDAALERLYRSPDQFGRCEGSGREIPFERLDIVPWVRQCGGGEDMAAD